MQLNPITHENRLPISRVTHAVTLTSLIAGTTLHYLGNRYIWRWYGDGQLLTTHAVYQSGAILTRLSSNLFPGEAADLNPDGTVASRKRSTVASIVDLGVTFSPMVVLPYFGQPALSFWGCFIGFNFHGLVLAFPAVILSMCVGAGVALVDLLRNVGRAQAGPQASLPPPPETTLTEQPLPCSARFDEESLKRLPTSYELDMDAQFDINRVVSLYSDAYPDDLDGRSIVAGKINEVNRNLVPSADPAARQFVTLLRNVGVELQKLEPADRKVHLKDIRLAFDLCPTQWNDAFDFIYESMISGGQGIEWQVERHHHRIKWAIVMEHIFLHLDPGGKEEVHWRITWVNVLGPALGMEMPAGINGEEVMFQNNRAGLGWLAQRFTRGLLNLWVELREKQLRLYEERWKHLFVERYTPRLLVDYWMALINDNKRVQKEIVGDDSKNHELSPKIMALIMRLAQEDDVNNHSNDSIYDLGYYDNDLMITEKGVIRFLQEMGVFAQ